MFTSEIETSYENKVKLYLEYSKKNVFVFKPKRIYEKERSKRLLSLRETILALKIHVNVFSHVWTDPMK